MGYPTTRQAYQDCYTVFEQAVEDKKGVRVLFPTREKAEYFRSRLNQARAIRRKDNAKIYDVGHPMHGASEFDHLVSRIFEDTNGEWWVYVQSGGIDLSVVERLSEVEPDNDDTDQVNK